MNNGLSKFQGTGTFTGFGKSENDMSFPSNLAYIALRISEPEGCERSATHIYRFCALPLDTPINYMRGPRWIDNGGPFIADNKNDKGENQERKLMGIFEYNTPRTKIAAFIFVPYIMSWVEEVTGHKIWE